MAFSWTEERVKYLQESAGRLKTQEIAASLGTNITTVRNKAVRLRLCLRVPAFTQAQAETVRELYALQDEISVRDIATLTGLSCAIVGYILYSRNRKTRDLYHRVRFLEFETEDGMTCRVQEELVDARLTPMKQLSGGEGKHDVWLLDGSCFRARSVCLAEQITVGEDRARRGG